MTPAKIYPLARPGTIPHRKSEKTPASEVMATPTGEFREPKKGEWFLSGAVIEAYQAESDATTKYYIARLVRVRKVITEVIEEL